MLLVKVKLSLFLQTVIHAFKSSQTFYPISTKIITDLLVLICVEVGSLLIEERHLLGLAIFSEEEIPCLRLDNAT